jgi:hypothetical protein
MRIVAMVVGVAVSLAVSSTAFGASPPTKGGMMGKHHMHAVVPRHHPMHHFYKHKYRSQDSRIGKGRGR